MEQYARFFDTLEELDQLLDDPALGRGLAQARSALAQLFISHTDDAWAQAVAARVAARDDRIVVVGASTAGEICTGRVRSASNVLSLLLFTSSELCAEAHDCASGQEGAMALRIVADLARPAAAPLKGLLLLAASTGIDTSLLLQELHRLAPGLPLFGGAAGDSVQLGRTVVLHGQRVLDQGYVVVGLYGHELEVMRQTYLGWEPMGQRMRATRASGRFVIETIDGRPAMEVYRHYLGIENDETLFLNAMESPLLVERDGHQLARVPCKALPGGAIEFIGDVREGEELQFGYAHLDGIVERAQRYGQRFSVMLCDIDYFKRFNDTYGHEVGDEVLRQVAHALLAQVRNTDTVCRYGGEEFVVLLPNTGLDEAMLCAERLRRTVASLCEQPGHVVPCQVTLSFGVAECPTQGRNEASLLVAADRALYAAKHAGRNRVCAAGLAP
jgi:diguanylate cyclase (GGDEF)-like protein